MQLRGSDIVYPRNYIFHSYVAAVFHAGKDNEVETNFCNKFPIKIVKGGPEKEKEKKGKEKGKRRKGTHDAIQARYSGKLSQVADAYILLPISFSAFSETAKACKDRAKGTEEEGKSVKKRYNARRAYNERDIEQEFERR